MSYAKNLVMPVSADAYPWAFHALNRFLGACTTGKPAGYCASEGGYEFANVDAYYGSSFSHSRARSMLLELAEGPYFDIVSFLDPTSLGQVDATCKTLREANRGNCGPWSALGTTAFHGLELDSDGLFDQAAGEDSFLSLSRKVARVDWKGRYARFRVELPTFRTPFTGPRIMVVDQADEIAYCRCRLRTDLLAGSMDAAYLEVQVVKNPDNVSLAVVDFEAGGCSSVTFSPDTGAVIRERKVRESPRKVEGAYIQPLATITAGQGFEGSMGLYLRGGHLAFFRRHATRAPGGTGDEEPLWADWETTGFVTDLSWAEGKRLTPCLAFRNEGAYEVRMICVNSTPPVKPERNAMAYQEHNWSSLDWDATEQDAPDM